MLQLIKYGKIKLDFKHKKIFAKLDTNVREPIAKIAKKKLRISKEEVLYQIVSLPHIKLIIITN